MRVLDSGRVVSGWSVALTLPVSLTVMAPASYGAERLTWLMAVVLAWMCFAGALAFLGLLERRLVHPRVRRTVVIGGVIAAAAARPVVLDAWVTAFGGDVAPSGHLPFRVATNVVVWAVMLLTVAVTLDALRALRTANTLLRSVLRELETPRRSALAYTSRARRTVQDATSHVQRMADALQQGPATRPDVQRLADAHLRGPARRLAALARESVDDVPPGIALAGTSSARHIAFRLPPAGVVSTLYVACMLPYAVRTAPLSEILAGVALVLCSGLALDLIPRRILRRGRTAALTLFAVMALNIGLLLSAVAWMTGAGLITGLVPAVVYPLIAFCTAGCAGEVRALRVEQRRLSNALTGRMRLAHAGTRRAREGLRTAATFLHRDAQGRSIAFALRHPEPSASALAELVDDLGVVARRVADVMDAPRQPRDAPSLDALVDTWGRVLSLRVQIDAEARTGCAADAAAGSDVYDIVAEGLLNAAKHGLGRHADVVIDLVTTGAGPHVRVRVTSPGALPAGVQLHPSSHARALGARLDAVPDGVRLEGRVALLTPDAVVSADHLAEASIRRP
ncbi:hypothetical protein [Microbacterium sp. SLBN-146]|uniref:hypothetical protein n=1 Tax=Microbacterium sp. SLBN-146 TaxID=2768457 RepID=UPI0011513B73|nr:hypothetical protein [Microbacterium sp. SLBN-146]